MSVQVNTPVMLLTALAVRGSKPRKSDVDQLLWLVLFMLMAPIFAFIILIIGAVAYRYHDGTLQARFSAPEVHHVQR